MRQLEYTPYDFRDELMFCKVRRKQVEERLSILNEFAEGVLIATERDKIHFYSYQTLFDDFERVDGTPCGKLKGE